VLEQLGVGTLVQDDRPVEVLVAWSAVLRTMATERVEVRLLHGRREDIWVQGQRIEERRRPTLGHSRHDDTRIRHGRPAVE
jgi:hypothetical protein